MVGNRNRGDFSASRLKLLALATSLPSLPATNAERLRKGARDKTAEQFCAGATEQSSHDPAKSWIASLALAMTRQYRPARWPVQGFLGGGVAVVVERVTVGVVLVRVTVGVTVAVVVERVTVGDGTGLVCRC